LSSYLKCWLHANFDIGIVLYFTDVIFCMFEQLEFFRKPLSIE